MATRDALGILIYDVDEAGKITFGTFPGGAVPTTADKYAAGCILMANGKVYSNAGTSASPSFQDINDVSTGEIADGAVTLAKLATGVTPSHVVKYGGQATTAGGAAAEAITVTGAAATDLAFVQMVDDGTSNVTIINAVVTTNTLTVTFSADPGSDTIVNYQLLRAAA